MLTGIAFELAGRGLPVAALSGQPAYRQDVPRLPRLMERNGVQVRRVHSTRLDKNRPLGRVLNTVTFAGAAFFSALAQPRPAVVLAVTNPPLLLWIARAVGAWRHLPVVLIIHDVYPQIVVALGRFHEASLLNRLWRILNRWAYRGAARIVVLDEAMAGVIRAELPPPQRQKVTVISNWSDGNVIRPVPRQGHPLRKEFGLGDDFVLLYSGNIGLFHEIETIVQAAMRLSGVAGIRFLFIGDGGQLAWLQRTVRENNLRNVLLLPFQPKERLPLTLTVGDAGFVTLKSAATGLCSPSKLYGLLAAGKPLLVVADAQAEAARVAGAFQCGITVPPGAGPRLAEEILRLRNDPRLLEEMGRRARLAFEQNYSLTRIAQRYDRLFRDVLEHTTPK
jgi:glycosyltransferase involved in cell wall biosynthesis